MTTTLLTFAFLLCICLVAKRLRDHKILVAMTEKEEIRFEAELEQLRSDFRTTLHEYNRGKQEFRHALRKRIPKKPKASLHTSEQFPDGAAIKNSNLSRSDRPSHPRRTSALRDSKKPQVPSKQDIMSVRTDIMAACELPTDIQFREASSQQVKKECAFQIRSLRKPSLVGAVKWILMSFCLKPLNTLRSWGRTLFALSKPDSRAPNLQSVSKTT